MSRAVHPLDEQLFIGLGSVQIFHGEGAFAALFLWIGGEISESGMAEGEFRVGLHGLAEEIETFVDEETIFALHDAHFVGLLRDSGVR